MSHHHTEIRGTVLWCRRRIPVDLIQAYGKSGKNGTQKREFRQSLKTRDPKEAERLARLRSVELDGEFDKKRRELAAVQVQAPPFELVDTELTDEQIRRLCLLWQRSVLETDDQNRIGGFFETDYDELREHLDDVEPALRQALARGQLDLIAPALHTFLSLYRVRVDEKSPAYRKLQYQFLQAIIQTVEAQKRRLNGEVVQTNVVAPLEAVYQADSPGSDRFNSADLYERWASSAGDRPLGTTSGRCDRALVHRHTKIGDATMVGSHLSKPDIFDQFVEGREPSFTDPNF